MILIPLGPFWFMVNSSCPLQHSCEYIKLLKSVRVGLTYNIGYSVVIWTIVAVHTDSWWLGWKWSLASQVAQGNVTLITTTSYSYASTPPHVLILLMFLFMFYIFLVSFQWHPRDLKGEYLQYCQDVGYIITRWVF